MAAMVGDTSSASYMLSDMAADAAGLLDALGIPAAHIVGASMGGMIAQAFAIEHPDKTLSLCSIMSTTGDTAVGQPTPEALEMLTTSPPQTVEEAADSAVLAAKVIGGKGYPVDEERIRARAVEAWNRDHDDARLGPPTRRASWRRATAHRGYDGVTVPTLVIHGVDDPLVTPSGGEATAEAIPGAELLNLEGMGHDLPIPLWPRIIDAIVENAEKAESRRPSSLRCPRTSPRQPRVLLDGLAYVESPRWHDDRLWFAHWGTGEIVAVDMRRQQRGRRARPTGARLVDRLVARWPPARHGPGTVAARARRFDGAARRPDQRRRPRLERDRRRRPRQHLRQQHRLRLPRR